MMGHLELARVFESSVGVDFAQSAIRPLSREADGYWSATLPDVPAGALERLGRE